MCLLTIIFEDIKLIIIINTIRIINNLFILSQIPNLEKWLDIKIVYCKILKIFSNNVK